MNEIDWFKNRGYVHITNKTPAYLKASLTKYISNPVNIAKHSFTPLIFKQLKQRRYKLSKLNGNSIRAHKTEKDGKIISNTKLRDIHYPTHIDALIYSYYAKVLISPQYEKYLAQNVELSNAVTAYRRIKKENGLGNKNNIHFANDVFEEIKKRENCVVLAFDIKNFFPSLNHKKLKLIWAKILGCKSLPKDHYNIFKSITKFSYIRLSDLRKYNGQFDEKKLAKLRLQNKNCFFYDIKDFLDSGITIYKNQYRLNDNLVGIPHGLPVSALLANMYMLPFDEAIINQLKNVYYRRYSDDMIIVCDENQIQQVKDFFAQQIDKIELNIAMEKTEEIHFKKDNGKLQSYGIKNGELVKNVPFNYLGFEFYGYQTLIKSKNLASFYRKMKDAVRRKHRRAEKIKEKHLLDETPIFKRKIYRLFSFKGEKKRMIPTKKSTYKNGKLVVKTFERKYRGNYLTYAYKAANEMNAPEIKRQLRNHWKILQKTLRKYEFSNSK